VPGEDTLYDSIRGTLAGLQHISHRSKHRLGQAKRTRQAQRGV
jgi:hypothetical protein